MAQYGIDSEDVFRVTRINVLASFLALAFGAMSMSTGLAIGFLRTEPFPALRVRDAANAVDFAQGTLPKSDHIRKLDKVELSRGLDPNDARDMVWNVQFDVDRDAGTAHKVVRRTVDVQVETNGDARVVEKP